MRAAHATHLLVVDLEATCSSDGSLPRLAMETIEFGAVVVRLGGEPDVFPPVAEYQAFVRPVRHPKLTPFCTQLTSITQADVDAAPTFPEAFAAFVAATVARFGDVVWGSWGKFDDTQLRRDCAHHGLDYPMPAHLNLKAMFGKAQSLRGFGMARALELCDLSLDGTHHRALDDTRNVVKLLPWILGTRDIDPAKRRRRR